MKFMIRADDLGYSKGVNYGILDTIQSGTIKNVGFMVNMPDSLHGYNLVKDFDICLGQHTNICLGYPCADAKLIPSLLKKDGRFKSSKEYRNSCVDLVNLDEVIIEVEAQYQKFISITGKSPSYFETHAVNSDNLNRAIQIVGERHHLKVVPTIFEGSFEFHKQDMFLHMDSNFYPNYNPFKSFKNMLSDNRPGIHLMVFHPGYIDQTLIKNSSWTEVRTLEADFLISAEFKKYIKDRHLYTFDEI